MSGEQQLRNRAIIERCREMRAEFREIHHDTSRPWAERIARERKLIQRIIGNVGD